MPLKSGYMYVWEYRVAPEHVEAFVRAYSPSGDWVRLFRGAPGYVRSELHRDRLQPERFVTIDYWESRAAWEEFRARFAKEFEAWTRRASSGPCARARSDSSSPWSELRTAP